MWIKKWHWNGPVDAGRWFNWFPIMKFVNYYSVAIGPSILWVTPTL